MTIIRENLNAIAKKRKISVASIARGIGVIPQTLNTYLRGNPRIDTLKKITDYLQIEVEELVGASAKQYLLSETLNIVSEPTADYGSNLKTEYMSELQNLQEKYELLKEVAEQRKEKILRLEQKLEACEKGNRVYSL
jgi:transcriptional regulator with XRE-family HTH domain